MRKRRKKRTEGLGGELELQWPFHLFGVAGQKRKREEQVEVEVKGKGKNEGGRRSGGNVGFVAMVC